MVPGPHCAHRQPLQTPLRAPFIEPSASAEAWSRGSSRGRPHPAAQTAPRAVAPFLFRKSRTQHRRCAWGRIKLTVAKQSKYLISVIYIPHTMQRVLRPVNDRIQKASCGKSVHAI